MHAHDAQERLYTDHPGSKRPRYAGEVPGQSGSLKPKNRAKWRRRKKVHRQREKIAARSRHAQRLTPEAEAAKLVGAQFDALMEDE